MVMLMALVLVAACSRQQAPAAPSVEKTTLVQDADSAIAAVDEADTLADLEAEQELDDLEAVLEQVQ